MVRRLAVLAALALLSLAVPAVASSDAPQQATNVPISFTAWAHCPEDGGEQVAWEGAMHLSYIFTQDAARGFREQFHADIHLRGVGLTTGDRYLANGASTLSGNYPPAGISIVTDVEHYHEIHSGEALTEDDYTSRFVLTRDGFVDQQSCT